MHELLGPLVLFAAAMCLTPGPNVVMITATAVNFGFRRSIPQMLGVTLGFGFMVMAAGFGLAGLFQAEPRLHAVLKYAGAIYLLYLAWRIANADAASKELGTSKADQFFRGSALHVGQPQGLGNHGGGAGGFHDRWRRCVAANLGDRRRARCGVSCFSL